MAGSRSEYGRQNQEVLSKRGTFAAKYRRDTIELRFTDIRRALALADRPTSLWRSDRVSRSHDMALGTANWEEALHLAKYGWQEGRKLLVKGLNEAFPLVSHRVQHTRFDVAGAYPDVPRYLAGDIECMVDMWPEERAMRPIVKLALSPVAGFSTSPKKIALWGAALVSTIDDFERRGIRTRINWVSLSQPSWIPQEDIEYNTGGPLVFFSIILKEPDQHVEIDRISFWLMHVSAQRRIQFALKEQLNIEKWYYYDKEADDGMGKVYNNEIHNYIEKDEVFISANDGAANPEDAARQIKLQIDRHTHKF